jgi:hypothetical protein
MRIRGEFLYEDKSIFQITFKKIEITCNIEIFKINRQSLAYTSKVSCHCIHSNNKGIARAFEKFEITFIIPGK